jgi:hypothetical protein
MAWLSVSGLEIPVRGHLVLPSESSTQPGGLVSMVAHTHGAVSVTGSQPLPT